MFYTILDDGYITYIQIYVRRINLLFKPKYGNKLRIDTFILYEMSNQFNKTCSCKFIKLLVYILCVHETEIMCPNGPSTRLL